jgi:CBS domain containing-hemolysin-like protein
MTLPLPQLALILGSFMLGRLFCSAEAAFVSVNHLEVKALASAGNPQALVLDRLLADRGRLINHMLIGINSATIVTSVMVASVTADILGSQYIGLTAGLLVLAVLLFQEIVPKALAYSQPLPTALRLARPAAAASSLFAPLAALLGVLPSWLARRAPEAQDDLAVSEESLTEMVRLGVEQGELSPGSSEVVSGILAAGDTRVSAVMVPWAQVVSVPGDADLQALVAVLTASGFSRLPVVRRGATDGYAGCPDAVGVVHVKDAFARLYQRQPATAAEIMRPVVRIAGDRTASDALAEMRTRRQHLAIVTDQASRPVGVITIQDLLEDIVGEVSELPPFEAASGDWSEG